MSTTTTRSPYHSHPQRSSYSKPSTTPHALPTRTPASVGQPLPPRLTPNARSPKPAQDPRTPSPNYFGFIVETTNPPDSNPGDHARRNWDFPSSQAHATTASPRQLPVDANPEFEAFRRQSESNNRFFLNNTSLSSLSRQKSDESTSTKSPTAQKRPMNSPISPMTRKGSPPSRKRDDDMEIESDDSQPKSFFDLPRNDSPSSMSSGLTIPDIRSHRQSVPSNNPSSSEDESHRLQKLPNRAETLPASGIGAPTLAVPSQIADLIKSHGADVLLLDLRVYPQYSTSRIRGALNLCIPTTLLKRPSFNVQKLLDTFTNDKEKRQFSTWRQYKHIVVYDANSSAMKEAIAPTHVLKKFINEGWHGHAHILKGGFVEFSRRFPSLVDKDHEQLGGSGKQTLSLGSSKPDVAPVAGGCPMPATQSAANPFFGNIRQNMDLIGGVGQMSIKYPDDITAHSELAIPAWLRIAAEVKNEGKEVSDKFLEIEKTEQKRMQEALSGRVSYGDSAPEKGKQIQIAGIEKGSKNRYNNIFPYDHTRVRLQDVTEGGCDYINANHVKAGFSNKHYVATQAPIPATFQDFWRVVWEQDVRVIVMLTAESEGGQVKSHRYWNSGDYGPFKLKSLSEKKVQLDDTPKPSPLANPLLKRPSIGQRRSTNPHTAAEKTQATEETRLSTEAPFITIRHLTLSHSAYPFQPMRHLIQIQYSSWPDFGAPAHPKDLLQLIKHTDKYVRNSMKSGQPLGPDQPMPEDQRPVLVHCSAGCGRTGTFCTVDSVIDMLKRQRLEHGPHTKPIKEPGLSAMDVDTEDKYRSWSDREDIDLIAKTVEDFRSQRLSMVQSLRQFVLCYESVLEWIVSEDEKGGSGAVNDPKMQRKSSMHVPRRSFGG